MNEQFLRQVARYYASRPGDVADLVFVTPNKRSALFLKRYFQQEAGGRAMFMPRFAALPAWISRLAPRRTPDRWEALFILYDCYRRLLRSVRGDEQPADFDRFIFWGGIISSDFDDIDRSLASPRDVYTNLYRLHSIQADYLTPEQKEVIRLLWGETPMTEDIDRFWFHTSEKQGGMSGRFVALWELLGDLYESYRAALEERGYATAGMQSRLAAEAVCARPLDELTAEGRRYVFVGLGEIYPAEKKIMDRLALAGVAEFVWDTSACDIYAEGAAPRGVSTVGRLADHYRMPDDFPEVSAPEVRKIEILGVPSSVAQAKIAGEIVARLIEDGEISADDAIDTAVVVPDPSLLIPLMLALPESLRALNVTMALPYSQTTFATLLRAIVAMQMHKRRRRGEYTYFYSDVLEILAHPHIRLIAPGQADALADAIRRGSVYNIDSAMIHREAPMLDFIFAPLTEPDSMEGVYGYLRGLLGGLDSAMRARVTAEAAGQSLELMMLEELTRRVEQMRALMGQYCIETGEQTMLGIFERLLASDMLTLTGTPLRGLQVMGALETRGLDFDNLIFLSLNERIFPSRDTIRTMIPNALRRGYGLPPIDREETAMNYYFYRSISRAARTWLLYDSRPAALGGGEMSRYITQILYGPLSSAEGVEVSHRTVDLTAEQPSRRVISVAKTAGVMEELDALRRPDGGRNLSASALKQYMCCPLAFYLKYVKGFRSDDEPTDYLNAADMGDLLHKGMEHLYQPWRGRVIEAGDIGRMLGDGSVRRALMEAYYEVRPAYAGKAYEELPAEAMLVISQLDLQISQMLEAEKEQYAPFVFVAAEHGEAETKAQWEISPGLRVNFRMNIDRIDRAADGSWLRFIDYKTGGDELSTGREFDNIFGNDHKRHAIFQLLLYRAAYRDIHGCDVPIELRLHVVRDIMKNGRIRELACDGRPLREREDADELFRQGLDTIVRRIFDDTTPFDQAEDISACQYCTMQRLCNRQGNGD